MAVYFSGKLTAVSGRSRVLHHNICEVTVMALEGPEMLYYLKQHTVKLRAVDRSTIPFWKFMAKIHST